MKKIINNKRKESPNLRTDKLIWYILFAMALEKCLPIPQDTTPPNPRIVIDPATIEIQSAILSVVIVNPNV